MTQTIEQLTARVRELEEELTKARFANIVMYGTSHPEMFKTELDYCKEQVLSLQAYAEQLREALEKIGEVASPYRDGVKFNYIADISQEALAIPRDTSALDAYVAKRLHDMACDKGLLRIQVEELTRQRDLAVEALENCRLLAARHRKEEWAGHIMRFCKDAGLSGSPIRNDSIKESEAMAQVCEGGVK